MGLKKNILYSGFLTTSLYIFQFITYPYVARVLGVTNIGICNYVQSIVQYFCLFSMLGITTLGVREIAKCNGDKLKLNQTFSQLFTLNAVFTAIVLAIYFLLVETIPNFIQYRKLLYIGATQIFFGTFAVEWLFRGLEEFKYITIRNPIIKILSVGFLLIAVQTPDDLLYYGFYTVLGTIGNNVLNFFRLRKHISLRVFKIQDVNIWKHLKPALAVFLFNLITSIYLNLNKVMLGFMQDDMAVGYYTAATNLSHVILYGVTSLGAVLLPRSSNLIKNNRSCL